MISCPASGREDRQREITEEDVVRYDVQALPDPLTGMTPG